MFIIAFVLSVGLVEILYDEKFLVTSISVINKAAGACFCVRCILQRYNKLYSTHYTFDCANNYSKKTCRVDKRHNVVNSSTYVNVMTYDLNCDANSFSGP